MGEGLTTDCIYSMSKSRNAMEQSCCITLKLLPVKVGLQSQGAKKKLLLLKMGKEGNEKDPPAASFKTFYRLEFICF